MFAKSCGTEELDSINYLLDSKDHLMQKSLNLEKISEALDLLAVLLGYDNLDQMVEERAGGVNQGGKDDSRVVDSLPKRK